MKELIFNTIEDLVTDFLYYDRREDEELSVGYIELAIEENEITIDEIIKCFSDNLKKQLNNLEL